MMENWRCRNPGAVEDWELEAYIDGKASPHVQKHLDQCPACRNKLAERRLFEGRLRQALYRSDCPSPHMLRDYYWDDLPADERQRIQTHLETCPHCTQELKDLSEFLATEGARPTDSVLSRVRQAAEQVRLVLAQLVSPVPQPVPALRGETQKVLLFEAGDIALSVNLEQEELGTYTLFGQVLLLEPKPLSESYTRLTAVGLAPQQAPLDANGGFALSDLPPGVYQLVVHLPEQRIVVPRLALKVAL